MADEESELVAELKARLTADEPKVASTFRLFQSTYQRLKMQEKRWNISSSYLVEKALQPVLDSLEKAEPPTETTQGRK